MFTDETNEVERMADVAEFFESIKSGDSIQVKERISISPSLIHEHDEVIH
jgi:hypothetical protein